jgi:hypothetical protein
LLLAVPITATSWTTDPDNYTDGIVQTQGSITVQTQGSITFSITDNDALGDNFRIAWAMMYQPIRFRPRRRSAEPDAAACVRSDDGKRSWCGRPVGPAAPARERNCCRLTAAAQDQNPTSRREAAFSFARRHRLRFRSDKLPYARIPGG